MKHNRYSGSDVLVYGSPFLFLVIAVDSASWSLCSLKGPWKVRLQGAPPESVSVPCVLDATDWMKWAETGAGEMLLSAVPVP